MIGVIRKGLRRFLDADKGSAVVPFAMWTPLMVGIALSTIELGALTMRHVALERALDQTVREVKLGTGRNYTHDQLKTKICDRASVLVNCQETLQLEMVTLNMRSWREPEANADCVDTSTGEVTPQRTFEHGQEHETMMLRACYKYRPISPTSYLAAELPKDAQGYTALVSTASFVHEPM